MSALVIFGATGDLMHQKLLPALANLYQSDKLPQDTTIYCVGRRNWDTADYLKHAKQEAKDLALLKTIEPLLTYIKIDLDTTADYERLKTIMDGDNHAKDRIFYLALPPTLFPKAAEQLANARLIAKGNPHERIVFEKPFGEDFASASDINQLLWRYFDESQIYRIDHYLGKEMIQNILTLRFANRVFESDWHKDSIEKITLYVKEKDGVKGRGAYYDQTGALRDMVQSHLFQMLALTTMEAPQSFDAKAIQKEKVSLLKKFNVLHETVVMGQYDGYLAADHVKQDSLTETFVKLEGRIDDSRWRDVPIIIMTGKQLDEKRSDIVIDFKTPTSADALWPDSQLETNQLIIKIAPKEGMRFTMNVKETGLSDHITTKSMDYDHGLDAFGNKPEAYEKLWLEMFDQNHLMFTRWDEIEVSWRIIDEIRANDNKKRLTYQPGSSLLKCLKEFDQ